MNKCQVCGKSIQGSLLCEKCETEVLEKQKGWRYVLSGILGIIFIAVSYLLWTGYKENESQIDFTIVTGGIEKFYTNLTGFFASPYILIPAVIFFIILAFWIGVKISK